MSINYTIYDKQYRFSYKELKEDYNRFCSLSDREFMEQVPRILHFACFVSWIKELHPNDTISDEGIIHQLTHLLCLDEPLINLQEIREQFKTLLAL